MFPPDIPENFKERSATERGARKNLPETLDKRREMRYNRTEKPKRSERTMKHIQTLETRDLLQSLQDGGCGECQTSCQSACKTSCGVANQPCEQRKERKNEQPIQTGLVGRMPR